MTRKVSTLKQARQAALQGRVEEAIPRLRVYADRGDTSASASLAELLALQGEWEECLQRAGELIARPQSVYAGNVFDDMIRLLSRAGRETEDWTSLLRLTQTAEERVEENIADFAPPKRDAARLRYRAIFQALSAYAAREGVPPHELIQIFGTAEPTQAAQDAAYQLALQNVSQQPYVRPNSLALVNHHFGLVEYFRQESEGIRLYEEERMPARFDCAVFVAKAYVRQEQTGRAWDVLWKHMRRWWPLDPAQVAPVVLLVDRDLADLMTHERCEQVLRQHATIAA
jgi:hypothetical protein